MSDPDGPRDFWSRRKAAVKQAEADAVARQEAVQLEAQRAVLEQKTDADILEELGLPEPESLGKEDDFKRFLESAVPERLRRRALRRLWLTNPVLANLDGLNDYEEDFTDAATVVQGLKTAYQVGRGFLERLPDESETGSSSEVTEAGPPVPADVCGEDTASAQVIDASHNNFIQNGKTSVRLTQGDVMGQDDDGRLVSSEPDVHEVVDLNTQPLLRRRIRFDYS